MFRRAITIIKFLKEVFLMYFKPDSAIVRSYVILILAGKMTYDEVPELFNLREAVAEALGLEEGN